MHLSFKGKVALQQEYMEQVTPNSIRLIAAVSRLLDLHQSRRESGVSTPAVPERAGYNLSVALAVLEVLHDLQMERGAGVVSVSEVFELLSSTIPSLQRDELDFCLDTLKTRRDIHYAEHTPDGEIKPRVTFNTTDLIRVVDGYDQVSLTDNAQLLLRIGGLKDEWLFNDVEAERLVKAIEREQYDRIHDFCRGLNADIAQQNSELLKILDHPSTNALRDKLVHDGAKIEQSLSLAKINVNEAIGLLSSELVIDSFNKWRHRENAKFSWSNVLSELESVLQCLEAYSRNFVKFLDTLQQARPSPVQRIDFLLAINHISSGILSEPEMTLNALLSRVLPHGIDADIFHPGFLVGEVDFRINENVTVVPAVFSLDKTGTKNTGRLWDFLNRNRAVLMDRLKQSPLRFSELVEMTGFDLLEDETPSDFFGIYTVSDHLSGEASARIVVGFTREKFKTEHDGVVVSGSDPVLVLEEIK